MVTNTHKVLKRTIVSKLQFRLLDRLNNLISEDLDLADTLNGSLVVEIIPPENNTEAELPLIDGGETASTFDIEKGHTIVSSVSVAENSPGVDGETYGLKFTPTFSDLSEDVKLEPFVIKFMFLNDAEKQAALNSFRKDKISLSEEIESLNSTKTGIVRDIDGFRRKFDEASLVLANHLKTWKQKDNPVEEIDDKVSIDDIVKMIERNERDLDILEEADKTKALEFDYKVTELPEEEGVLGRIGSLALLEDHVAAFVLSWHMQADMEMIVTLTSEKAKELDIRYGQKQQLLPIDKIYKGNLAREWDVALPHQRSPIYFTVKGNPVYLRSMLHFPKEAENCKIVFTSLLGDTLLMDSLDDALEYRGHIVKSANCPTILTRDGRRLRSNGKFGGVGNNAPAGPEDLKFGVFGLAPNKNIAVIKKKIENLKVFRQYVIDKDEAKENYVEFKESHADELVLLQKQLVEHNSELEKCEKQIREASQRSLRREKEVEEWRNNALDSMRRGDTNGHVNGAVKLKRSGEPLENEEHSKRQCVE